MTPAAPDARPERGWHSVRTIPTDAIVTVRTVTGIVCKARTYPIGEDTRWVIRARPWRPYTSVHCYRVRRGKITGDVKAIAWRP